MDSNKTVLCAASAYEMKYYFNEQFNAIPESIKEELHILCVLFTEEVHQNHPTHLQKYLVHS